MTKSLRRRHFQLWLVLAVLAPAGIFLAWLAIPVRQPVKLLTEKVQTLLPEQLGKVDKKDYLVVLRANREQTAWQLEWKSKTTLAVPSAVIYRMINPEAGITSQKLIGRIEAKKDYVFDLPADSAGYSRLQLVLYDFIHEQVIDHINLLP